MRVAAIDPGIIQRGRSHRHHRTSHVQLHGARAFAAILVPHTQRQIRRGGTGRRAADDAVRGQGQPLRQRATGQTPDIGLRRNIRACSAGRQRRAVARPHHGWRQGRRAHCHRRALHDQAVRLARRTVIAVGHLHDETITARSCRGRAAQGRGGRVETQARRQRRGGIHAPHVGQTTANRAEGHRRHAGELCHRAQRGRRIDDDARAAHVDREIPVQVTAPLVRRAHGEGAAFHACRRADDAGAGAAERAQRQACRQCAGDSPGVRRAGPVGSHHLVERLILNRRREGGGCQRDRWALHVQGVALQADASPRIGHTQGQRVTARC